MRGPGHSLTQPDKACQSIHARLRLNLQLRLGELVLDRARSRCGVTTPLDCGTRMEVGCKITAATLARPSCQEPIIDTRSVRGGLLTPGATGATWPVPEMQSGRDAPLRRETCGHTRRARHMGKQDALRTRGVFVLELRFVWGAVLGRFSIEEYTDLAPTSYISLTRA